MKITATRLGQSPLTLDWSGLPPQAHSPDEKGGHSDAFSLFPSQLFYDCPIQPELSGVTLCQTLADHLTQSHPSRWTDCLFLGIGGSILGPKSLLSALAGQLKTSHHPPPIRFHFMDTLDSWEWEKTLALLDPAHTLVCSVSKSGSTYETLAQTLLACDWLTQARWAEQLIIITDPQQGDLRQFANHYQLQTLPIPPSIGGRFSLFTPVGLFPAALAGLSLPRLLEGGKRIRDYLDKTPLNKNPLLYLAKQLVQLASRYPVHVLMPYCNRLEFLSDWFLQLWGESLGKELKGFTPVTAMGPKDQHSLLQLLTEGPDDKITFFLTVDEKRPSSLISSHFTLKELSQFPTFQLVSGRTLTELVEIEYQATAMSLARKNRPYCTLRLDQLDETSFGALTFTLFALTYLTGWCWGINPLDQPGVEANKLLIQQALQNARLTPAGLSE